VRKVVPKAFKRTNKTPGGFAESFFSLLASSHSRSQFGIIVRMLETLKTGFQMVVEMMIVTISNICQKIQPVFRV